MFIVLQAVRGRREGNNQEGEEERERESMTGRKKEETAERPRDSDRGHVVAAVRRWTGRSGCGETAVGSEREGGWRCEREIAG